MHSQESRMYHDTLSPLSIFAVSKGRRRSRQGGSRRSRPCTGRCSKEGSARRACGRGSRRRQGESLSRGGAGRSGSRRCKKARRGWSGVWKPRRRARGLCLRRLTWPGAIWRRSASRASRSGRKWQKPAAAPSPSSWPHARRGGRRRGPSSKRSLLSSRTLAGGWRSRFGDGASSQTRRDLGAGRTGQGVMRAALNCFCAA